MEAHGPSNVSHPYSSSQTPLSLRTLVQDEKSAPPQQDPGFSGEMSKALLPHLSVWTGDRRQSGVELCPCLPRVPSHTSMYRRADAGRGTILTGKWGEGRDIHPSTIKQQQQPQTTTEHCRPVKYQPV